MRRLFNKRGQSTLEYLLVLAGIIAALIVFRNVVTGNIQSSLNEAGTRIQDATSATLDSLHLGQSNSGN